MFLNLTSRKIKHIAAHDNALWYWAGDHCAIDGFWGIVNAELCRQVENFIGGDEAEVICLATLLTVLGPFIITKFEDLVSWEVHLSRYLFSSEHRRLRKSNIEGHEQFSDLNFLNERHLTLCFADLTFPLFLNLPGAPLFGLLTIRFAFRFLLPGHACKCYVS